METINLVSKVMLQNNLTDNNKVQKFFESVLKENKLKIETEQGNISILKLKQSAEISKIENDIEDLDSELENAYSNLNLKNLNTNSSIKDERDLYIKNIFSVIHKKINLSKTLSALKYSHEQNIKEIEDLIANYKAINDKILLG